MKNRGKIDGQLSPASGANIDLSDYVKRSEITILLDEIKGAIPTDFHINELIDFKLREIENGTY